MALILMIAAGILLAFLLLPLLGPIVMIALSVGVRQTSQGVFRNAPPDTVQ